MGRGIMRCQAVMGFGVFAVAMSVPANLTASTNNVISKRCDDEHHFLTQGWQQLSSAEPMFSEAFRQSSSASGTTNVFNCRVSWPVDSKSEPTTGLRTVVLDQQWYGQNKEFHHHGYRIRYHLSADPVSSGGFTVTRHVMAFETCRTPKACKQLQIPAVSDNFSMLKHPEEGQSAGRARRSNPPPTGGAPGQWPSGVPMGNHYDAIPTS